MRFKFTIDQLRTVVSRAILTIDCKPADAGRVRATPDVRTIRYYTTLGLMDRPSEMVGRTGYYEQKHVLQLVAIKQLQANGISLAEIQRKLSQADDRQLARLAALPRDFWQRTREYLSTISRRDADLDPIENDDSPSEQSTSNMPFWSQPVALPSPVDSHSYSSSAPPSLERADSHRGTEDDSVKYPQRIQADRFVSRDEIGLTIPIHETAQLHIRVATDRIPFVLPKLSEEAIAQLRAAAQPLIEELRRRQIIP